MENNIGRKPSIKVVSFYTILLSLVVHSSWCRISGWLTETLLWKVDAIKKAIIVALWGYRILYIGIIVYCRLCWFVLENSSILLSK